MMIGENDILKYCRSIKYDDCPLLLSYVLRKGAVRKPNRFAMAFSSFLLICIISFTGCAATHRANAPAEPTVEYFKLDSGKLKPGKVKANAYYEIAKDKKIYVFISPKAKEAFETSGSLGKSPVTGIGFGPDGETVIFESDFAQKEFEKRHVEE